MAGTFPPDGPTTTQKIIPSYLFQQYADDDALQAFVLAYNTLAQEYADTFNQLNLPIYTQGLVQGMLLDWVGQGLYGVARPFMPRDATHQIGPFNTWAFNTLPFNTIRYVSLLGVSLASDDLYRRVITWRFFKGDGRQFNITWLKRRVEQFLHGANGINNNTAETYDISVRFNAVKPILDITIHNAPFAAQLRYGINSGVLELPFQFQYRVIVEGPLE